MLCPICIAKGYSKKTQNDEKSLTTKPSLSKKINLFAAYKIPIIKK